jgi:hypothetical protein
LTVRTVENRVATRADLRRARRSSFSAALGYRSAQAAIAFGVPVGCEILEELEIRARLEWAAYDELLQRGREQLSD